VTSIYFSFILTNRSWCFPFTVIVIGFTPYHGRSITKSIECCSSSCALVITEELTKC